jgi:hypothetical protein
VSKRISIEITWYLGRAISDIRKVEDQFGEDSYIESYEQDVNILRDMRYKLYKLWTKYAGDHYD